MYLSRVYMGVITGVILSLYSSGRGYQSAHISSLSLWCSCRSTVIYCMALGCFMVFFGVWSGTSLRVMSTYEAR